MARFPAMRRGAWLVCTLAALASRPARAGDSGGAEASLVKDMVKEAVEDEKAGKCADAIDLLKQAVAIRESAEVLLHLGSCLSKTGKLRAGLRTLEKARDLALKEKDSAVQRSLAPLLGELRITMSTITVSMPGDVQATVTIDGEATSAEQLAKPIAVDPGEHVIEARAPGRTPFTKRLTLDPGATSVVDVVLGPDRPAVASHPGPAPSKRIPIGTWIAGGAAVALAAGGVIAYVAAGSSASDGQAQCASQQSCDPSLVSQVRQLDAAALAMWIGAGVGVGTAVTLYVLENRSPANEPPRTARSAWVVVGPGAFGLAGRF